jgi:hypothetical protein
METVAFITCVSDKSLYDKCCGYIHVLDKTGFEFEMVSVMSKYSLPAAYNEAMRKSKARYKIYLHQDAFILDVNFLHHIDNIFKINPNIGMIGVMGGRYLPIDKNPMLVWDCKESWGAIFHYVHQRVDQGLNPEGVYDWVHFIDGCIMVTQYDIFWREDILQGFHFYDLSHSLEFRKQGYAVVVPRQETPWVAHMSTSGITYPGYERLRRKFIQEYHQFLLPGEPKPRTGSLSFQGKLYRFKI